jgi:hypothetical protein
LSRRSTARVSAATVARAVTRIACQTPAVWCRRRSAALPERRVGSQDEAKERLPARASAKKKAIEAPTAPRTLRVVMVKRVTMLAAVTVR